MGSIEGIVDSQRAEVASLRARVAELEKIAAQVDLLRSAELELRAIFQVMTDVVLVMDRDGRYLKIAPTAPNLLYRPSEELLGKTVHDVMPAEKARFFVEHIRAALDGTGVGTMEYSLTIRGAEVWFSATISRMEDRTVVVVARDITAHKRAEQELQRAAVRQQEEIIRAQAEALAQLSTPLIPISDTLVVMPLIGAFDTNRMDRVMSTLLSGIADRGAAVAIIDVTGVPAIEAPVADGLIRVARAAQLLGAQVVLTGLRPDVAQALVNLGADLGGIVTRGTLQSGIAYAIAKGPR